MLIELAIGDAYGAGFEFVDQQTIELYNNLNGYIKHPRHDIGPGCYTDDTQMSLAVAEAIVSREPWTPELLATKKEKSALKVWSVLEQLLLLSCSMIV
jgi:ADP-ribosylglycohydrolase